MEIQYVYVKTRSQFGKQCIFDDSEATVEENIFPTHEMMKNYINMNPVHQNVHCSRQFAGCEVQTKSTVTKETGMNHTEGGWPKEINPRDEEVVARFRRRIEKDDMWAPRMRELTTPIENYVFQNNALNIYENYFDGMTSANLVLPVGVRTVNIFEDPEAISQPITHLTWSPDHGTRLAASYCSMEFQRIFLDSNLCSYIWDIENPNKAFMALKAVHPSVTIEFNPRDPSMLISGLLSGQVCNWDIRSGNTPIFMSHPQFSHRNPANCALWINSKTNSEFFSASTDGTISWWDIRMLHKPTGVLIMDLENPSRGDIVKAVGVSALQFEPTMSTKFMAGMENGVVISGTRKAKNATEMLSLRFDCHNGPVIALDRNPFTPKNFLTIGDWSTKIWAEDTKESNLISTRQHGSILTGGCWSTSRCSVFYVINNKGMIEIFDILVGLKAPVITTRLSEDSLKAIAPQENGKLVAVGNSKGKIYIVESSEALTTNFPNDKALMAAYLERCSRYGKAVDNRLKESRLLQRINYSESISAIPAPKIKTKEKRSPRKSEKDKKVDEKKKIEKDKKKVRQRKTKNIWELFGDPSLADVEKKYFETIDKEKEKYAEAALLGSEKLIQVPSIHSGADLLINKKGKHDDLKTDKDKGVIKKRAQKQQRSSKRKNTKDKDARLSKEIIIIRRKSDTLAERMDGGPIDEKLDEQKMEIIGDETIKEEKYLGQTTQDDEIGRMLSIKQKKIKPRESMTDSQGEQVDTTLEDIEELKMNALIEKMFAGYPKNILPLNQLKDLPRYMEKHRKLSKKEHHAASSITVKALKEARKEIFKPTELITPKSLIYLKHFKQSDDYENKNVKKFEEFTKSQEIVSNKEIELLPENVKIKQNPIKTKNKSNKKLTINDDCQPVTINFGSKEITNIIEMKMNFSRSLKIAKSSELPKDSINQEKISNRLSTVNDKKSKGNFNDK